MEDEQKQNAFDDVKWDDILINGEKLIIQGKSDSTLLSKDLRRICSGLKTKKVKNATKQVMIKKIIDTHSNREKYNNLHKEICSKVMKTRMEPQCSYRLMNIIFSDKLAGKLATLGDVANQNVLDIGKAANDEFFWEEVWQVFDVARHEGKYSCIDAEEERTF